MTFKFTVFTGFFFMMLSASYGEQTNQSYQTEFVFLKNQLSALQSRKQKNLNQLTQMENSLKSSIARLSAEVAKAESKNEILKSKISVFDKDRSDKDLSLKKVDVIKSQMKDFSIKSIGKEIEVLEELNSEILSYLKKGAKSYTVSKGHAFNSKGVKETGEIYNLGHVASYFRKGGNYIALALDTSSKSLVFTDHKVEEKDLFLTGGVLKPVPVHFKEGGLIRSKTFLAELKEKLRAGGAVGYVIIFLGFVGLFIALLRYKLISVYEGFDEGKIQNLVFAIQRGEVELAKKELKGSKVSALESFIDFILSNRNKETSEYEALVVSEISQVQSKVSKFGPYLLVLAGVAPLLGLLGTVTGMIGTFEMITLHGTGNPKLLSGGIKEALVTTQMGLVVAIPCILIGNYLSSKALKVVNKFEEVASSVPKA